MTPYASPPDEVAGEPAVTPGYWYDDDGSREVLESVRRFRRADQAMRRRIASGMSMNETDLHALQILVAAEGEPASVSPRDLARALAISTASTTKLLDRLEASGHLRRTPHPRDRRGIVVVATAHAHEEIRERLTRMHQEMAEVAARIPPEAREPVRRFLEELADLLDRHGDVAPLTPAR
ncbi:MarR family winged helix-turn-helix transcriptional regulator [Cellulomonas composti]|uniref:MarR family winged helix-turn-helix transcriptional regulator n=1 Tax=Cellulomonas composti TaxID=266130 RepID=UPI001FEA4037|nr:MarR family transcriptional regulator [Cellulomonas composti]